MATLPVNEAIPRLQGNEERFHAFVNLSGTYTTNETTPRQVQTLPSWMEEIRQRYLTGILRGDWVTATSYSQNDIVIESGNAYLCTSAHTSSVFATDLAARDWVLYQTLDASFIEYTSTLPGALTKSVESTLNEAYNFFHVLTPDEIADVRNGTLIYDLTDKLNAVLAIDLPYLYIPMGRYKIRPELVGLQGCNIFGDGLGRTILDASWFTSISDENTFSITGSDFVTLPAIASNIVKNDKVVQFASAPDLVKGDVFVIFDNTSGSFNPIRSYYKAGEMLTVASVSGNTVTVDNAVFDSYLSSNANIMMGRFDRQRQTILRDFSLVCSGPSSYNSWGLHITNVNKLALSNVEVSNATYSAIELRRCYDMTILTCKAADDNVGQGGDYGLSLTNCQKVTVLGGTLKANREGFSTGGGSSDYDVPIRELLLDSAHVGGYGTSQACNVHGNAEHVKLNNCMIYSGFSGSGDFFTMSNCHIFGENSNNNVSVIFSELRGCNLTLSNCKIYSNGVGTGRAKFIDIGSNSDAITSNTLKGGTISLDGLELIWDSPTGSNLNKPIAIGNRGYIGIEPISVSINNLKVTSLTEINQGQIEISTLSELAKPFNRIHLSNLKLERCGAFLIRGYDSTHFSAEDVILENITSDNCLAVCNIANVRNKVVLKNLTISDNNDYAAYIYGGSVRTKVLHVTGCTFLDNNKIRNGTSQHNSAISIQNIDTVMFNGNMMGSNTEHLIVSSNVGFIIGEVVTSVSGATAVIAGLTGTTSISIQDRVGTFLAENITGASSSITTAVTSTNPIAAYGAAFINVGTLLIGGNGEINSRANLEDTIGTKIVI